MNPEEFRYSDAEIEALWRALRERRDMRHFVPAAEAAPLPEGLIERLVLAAHLAPSVGYMQPWRFIRITDPDLRKNMHALVDEERLATAKALPSRNEEFLGVKIEGILDCGELLVVTLMPDREKHIIGRRVLPEMDIASVGCAIQNMWLAARAEGIGMGWVSIFDPAKLAVLFGLPEGAKAVAILCIGHVAAFYDKPMLEQEKWAKRAQLASLVYGDTWGQGSGLDL